MKLTNLSIISLGFLFSTPVLAIAEDYDHPWWSGQGSELSETCQDAKETIDAAQDWLTSLYDGYELELRRKLLVLLEFKIYDASDPTCDLIASSVIAKYSKA